MFLHTENMDLLIYTAEIVNAFLNMAHFHKILYSRCI